MKKRTIKAGGNKWTLDQWATHLGVAVSTIHMRLSLGWTEEEAVGVKLRPAAIKAQKAKAERAAKAERRAARQVTYEGFTGTIAELCRHLGIPDSPVRSRMNNPKWTLDESIKYELNMKADPPPPKK